MTRNQASYPTRVYRIFRLFFHLVYAVLAVACFQPNCSKARWMFFVRRWSLTLLNILNVRLNVKGAHPETTPANSILAPNHVSWLDIFMLYALYYTNFVAKIEVRAWPVIGWLCSNVGTLFIERMRRRDTARINQIINQALRSGDCVTIFPEGTTSDGTCIKAFHSSLLEPAVMLHSTLYPVALRYCDRDGGPNTEVAYAGETTLLESLLNILAQQEIDAELIFLAPISAQGKNRRELARAAETAIAGCLSLSVRRRKPGIPGGFPETLPTDFLPTDSPYPAPQDYPEVKDPALTSVRK